MENHVAFYCENCDVTDKTVNDFKMHATEYTEENAPSTSKCGKCPYESDDEQDMNIHMNQNHEKNTEMFSCDKCSFESNNTDIFTMHAHG